MWAAGVTDYVELGAKVLGPMVKRIAPDAATVSLVGMADIEAFAATL
jgi:[acyl-carrier-protein] S-malonyltransferase